MRYRTKEEMNIPDGYTQLPDWAWDERDELCLVLPVGQSPSKKLAKESTTYFTYHQMGIKPFVWQHMLFKEFRFQEKNILVNTPRQLGKSFADASIALHAAVYNLYPLQNGQKQGRTVIGIVSKTDEQSKKILGDIRALMHLGDAHLFNTSGGRMIKWFTSHLSTKQGDINNMSQITLRELVRDPKAKGNVIKYIPEGKIIAEIICHPPTDIIRGDTYSVLIEDETAHIDYKQGTDEEFFEGVSHMTLDATGGKYLMTTTPKGQSGYFYKLFDPDDVMDKNRHFRMWLHYEHIEDADRYERVLVEKEEAIRMDTYKHFQQEREAAFTANDESFFDSEKVDNAIDYVTIDKCQSSYPNPTDMGIDFGFVKANTIITISRLDKDNIARLVFHKIYPADKDLELYNDVLELIPQFNVQRVIVDECPAGKDFIQQARKDGKINLHLMNFKRDKQTKYFLFRAKLNRGEIKFYKEKRLLTELKAMTQVEQQIGSKISKPRGGSDDFVDSMLMSCYFFVEDKKPLRFLNWDDY